MVWLEQSDVRADARASGTFCGKIDWKNTEYNNSFILFVYFK